MRLAAFIAILFLAACATAAPTFQPGSLAAISVHKAQVIMYMYSPSTPILRDGPGFEVNTNGITRCAINLNSFIVFDVQPGIQYIAIPDNYDSDVSEIQISTKPAHRYFIKVDKNMENAGSYGAASSFGVLGVLATQQALRPITKNHGNLLLTEVTAGQALHDLVGKRHLTKCE